jgi:uncharacterized protein YbaR (Trm112 family)
MSVKPISPEDFRWIVCPVCHRALERQTESVRCTGCGRSYPIVDGIPVLLAGRVL